MLYMNVINIVVSISRYEYIVIYKKVEEWIVSIWCKELIQLIWY